MRALAMLTAVATLLAAACGDYGTDPQRSIAGTYVLQTVDGNPLPYVASADQAMEVAITAASVTLTDAGPFSVSQTVRFGDAVNGVELSMTGSGTYTRAGATITLSLVDEEGLESTLVGTLAERALTLISDGSTYVFQR